VSDASARQPGIAELARLVAELPAADRARFHDLFALVEDAGEMVVPGPMEAWVAERFGPVEQVCRQRVVRVANRWTFEGAIFNPLRANRPDAGLVAGPDHIAAVRQRIEQARGDDFCRLLDKTPADIFGRVAGRFSRTAANVARADGWHGIVVFDEHDPLALGAEQIADGLNVAREWAARAHAVTPEARHLFMLWNCLWRAGASQVHAHLQMLLSREMPQARVALWRSAAQGYLSITGRAYFPDLAATHQALSLTLMDGATTAFASLAPIKEQEVVLLAPGAAWSTPNGDAGADAAWQSAVRAVVQLVHAYRRIGVLAFDLALFGPPLDGEADWANFPFVARLVDRGDPLGTTADVAAMELFGSSVVARDPFALARTLSALRYTQSA
jgi:hypothetical protein